MNTDRIISLLAAVLIMSHAVAATGSRGEATAQRPAESVVLTIGTLHAQHGSNPHYTYQDLYRIMETFSPQVICVEIPPAYFRRKPYLKEMTMGALYGLGRGLEVYAIDWWPPHDARAERRAYMKTDDYRQKQAKLDSLLRQDKVTAAFIGKYGSLEKVAETDTMGWLFFNGSKYNNYVKRLYTYTAAVFGDGCMNLYAEQRNAKMAELISQAVDANSGKRILILTGAEHKYYFDDAMASRKDVRLVQLSDLLPLKSTPMDSLTAHYLRTGVALGYYKDKETAYRQALVPLLHGPDMDDEPETVRAEDMAKAGPIISEWELAVGNSKRLSFEKTWYYFLCKDYKRAIREARRFIRSTDKLPADLQEFIIPFFWRNLGFCYDMAGRRKKAAEAYDKGISACRQMGMNGEDIEDIYRDYLHHPYSPQQGSR